MTSAKQIQADPYAEAYFRKFLRRCSPIARLLPKTLWIALEPFLAALKQWATNNYHDHLYLLRGEPFCIGADGGEDPDKFFAAQIKYPKLRDLLEVRRAVEVLYDICSAVCRGVYDRE